MDSVLSRTREIVAAIASRADYADLFLQSGAGHTLLFDDGRMDSISSSIGDGVGVRIIQDGNTVYAHNRGAEAPSVQMALAEAVSLAGIDMAINGMGGSGQLIESLPTVRRGLDSDFFHELDRMLRGECPLVRQATFRFRTSRRICLIVRGDGEVARDDREYTSFSAHVVVERDGDLQTGQEARALLAGESGFWSDSPAEDASKIAGEALRRALLMLEARPCPAGAMTVLMDGSAGGTMVHEACGHGLEADIIQKDFSVYRDRIGELVASEAVTIVDDATLPCRYGSYRFDDEGTAAARNVLVENGVLRKYLTDILSSRECGLPLTGNGRRESYTCPPLPRMSNTFIAPGDSEPGEMQSRVKQGLLVKKMGGGEVNPTSGDFVFHVYEGYLLENGKVAGPVKGAILTGNGPEALCNIVAVGKDLSLHHGICGKSGQSVPVTDGQPALLIEGLTVGGSDTDNGS